MNWPMLAILFLCGWAAGVVLEYILHWAMHHWSLRFHLNHHRDFFVLPGRDVAIKDLDPRLNIKFFAAALVVLSPLMFLWGWQPVVAFWAGAFWHLVAVYEFCHAVMHYDIWLPRFVREGRLYRWWKGCHFQHHRHSPTGNYCVTFPVIDWCMGTYVSPNLDPAVSPADKP